MEEITCFIKKNFSGWGEAVKEIKRLETSGNLTFLIPTNKSKYILRLCGDKPRDRTHEEILSETKLLKFLVRNNIPVPDPIKINNDFVISINNRNGILYRYLKDNAVKNPNLAQCFAVGEILGKIHNLTTDFEHPHKRKSWDLESTKKFFQEIKEDLSKDEFLQRHQFIESVESILNDLDFPKELPHGAIHEDLGKRHVLFKGNKISRILDWDRSYNGQFILDLGQTIRGWCFNGWKEWNKERFHSVLNGYENQRKLITLEKEYLLKAIKFGLIERALAFATLFFDNKKIEDGEFVITSMKLIPSIEI
ncbi:Homoserine kinase [subsurface metagenome]